MVWQFGSSLGSSDWEACILAACLRSLWFKYNLMNHHSDVKLGNILPLELFITAWSCGVKWLLVVDITKCIAVIVTCITGGFTVSLLKWLVIKQLWSSSIPVDWCLALYKFSWCFIWVANPLLSVTESYSTLLLIKLHQCSPVKMLTFSTNILAPVISLSRMYVCVYNIPFATDDTYWW